MVMAQLSQEPIVQNRQRRITVKIEALEDFGRRLAQAVRLKPGSFSAVLVSDRRIRELNRRYRQQPSATDVLSFPVEENGYLGDVVISVETAKRQARQLRHGLLEELELLLLHGVLHLMGYDHENDSGQMDRREMTLRRRLGLET
jgi:probable rRNA maturation factor